MRDTAAELRKNRKGRLHEGVVGAHPQHGGIETPQADLDADETRFGPEARFVQGTHGVDSMNAGQLAFKSTKVADTEPYLRRREGQGTQLPLDTEGAFKPSDAIQHFVRLKHPHLAEHYSFEHDGDDYTGHQVRVYHNPEARVGNQHSSLNATPEQRVGFLRWSGKRGTGETAPGEIEGVAVHPEHRGAGLSTAMWDYARAHNALHGSQEPVHSKDRSTAGNHWAHFVGGKAMARQEGHDVAEHFMDEWRR